MPQLQTITRIAFASCFDQRMDQPTWDAIFAYRPHVFIAAGTMSTAMSAAPC